MNTNLKYKKIFSASALMVSVVVLSLFTTSCEFELPEADSIPDANPPYADFGYTENGEDYLLYNFSNLSTSATDYEWSFGDGTTSTDFEPIHSYPEVEATDTTEAGTPYTVTLKVSDKLNQESIYTTQIAVIKPAVEPAIVPVIINPSFDEPGDDGKYTSPWVDSNLGKTMQISTSSSFVGGKSSKFPNANTDPRIGYQSGIAVTKNTEYKISFVYSIEEGDPSTMIVAILGGTVSDPSEVAGATIASATGTEQGGKSSFLPLSIFFNSGDNETISIHMSNTGTATSYVEEFVAELNQ